MITTGRINAILEKLGTPHRAHPGGHVDETMACMLEALPAFIEKLVSDEVKRQLEDLERSK